MRCSLVQGNSGDAVRNETATYGVARISALSGLLTAIAGAMLCVLATGAHAQDLEMAGKVSEVRLDLLSALPNETGFTLGDLLDKNIWSLVTQPLRLGTLNQVGARTHRVPRPGVQLELLTPAAGVTIHFRW